jgi:hypothetical protein
MIPVSASSKAWACGRSLAGIAGSNPAGARMYGAHKIVFLERSVITTYCYTPLEKQKGTGARVLPGKGLNCIVK